jgi:hypothetical protein
MMKTTVIVTYPSPVPRQQLLRRWPVGLEPLLPCFCHEQTVCCLLRLLDLLFRALQTHRLRCFHFPRLVRMEVIECPEVGVEVVFDFLLPSFLLYFFL